MMARLASSSQNNDPRNERLYARSIAANIACLLCAVGNRFAPFDSNCLPTSDGCRSQKATVKSWKRPAIVLVRLMLLRRSGMIHWRW
jgi:hypothetical protein